MARTLDSISSAATPSATVKRPSYIAFPVITGKTTPSDIDFGERTRVGNGADTTGGDDVDGSGLGDLTEADQVRPFEGAVARDVGDDERVDAGVGERPGDVEHAAAAADEPAVGGDLAGLGVEADGDPVVGREIADEVGVGEGRGAVDPLHAGIEEGERGGPLRRHHRSAPGRARPPQWPQRRRGSRHAGAGRVEVDDVDQPPCISEASAWATGSSP